MENQENVDTTNIKKIVQNQPLDGDDTKQIIRAQKEIIKLLDEQIDAKTRFLNVLKNALKKVTETK